MRLLALSRPFKNLFHSFTIRPHIIEGKYTQPKTGAALLVYKTFLVAQDCAPSIIYMDNVDQIFKGGKKKKGGGGEEDASRIKKDLMKAIEQINKGPDSVDGDRVLFIGCTSKPYAEGVDHNGLFTAFEEKVYLSFPDYGSSIKMWQHAIEAHGISIDPTKLNLSTLAKVSVGYTCGSIKQTVDRVLTARRVQQLGVRPLQVSEFLGPLSRTNYTWPEEWHELRDFDHFITGEKARMDKAKDATAE